MLWPILSAAFHNLVRDYLSRLYLWVMTYLTREDFKVWYSLIIQHPLSSNGCAIHRFGDWTWNISYILRFSLPYQRWGKVRSQDKPHHQKLHSPGGEMSPASFATSAKTSTWEGASSLSTSGAFFNISSRKWWKRFAMFRPTFSFTFCCHKYSITTIRQLYIVWFTWVITTMKTWVCASVQDAQQSAKQTLYTSTAQTNLYQMSVQFHAGYH